MFVAAVVLLIASGVVTFRKNFNNPENVFLGMLESNLSSQGVTRSVTQESNGQLLSQILQAQVGEDNVIVGQTVLSQVGDGSNGTEIITESIGTPTTDYIRYSDIATEQKSQSGRDLDFSSVIGVWGQSNVAEGATNGGELFGEAVLGVVPFGYLDTDERQEFLKSVQELEVYEVDFESVDRQIVDGRPVYTYDVKVKPERYITMLKEFDELLGGSQLSTTDPSAFSESPDLTLEIGVDVWSRQLKTVNFSDNDRNETYNAYGLHREVTIPEETISIQELQTRLQLIQ